MYADNNIIIRTLVHNSLLYQTEHNRAWTILKSSIFISLSILRVETASEKNI